MSDTEIGARSSWEGRPRIGEARVVYDDQGLHVGLHGRMALARQLGNMEARIARLESELGIGKEWRAGAAERQQLREQQMREDAAKLIEWALGYLEKKQ